MIPLIGARRCLLQRGAFIKRLNVSIGRSLRRVEYRLSHYTLRFSSTSSAVKSSPKKPVKYPERLLIYNVGTGRTVFIGCLKVTTIFVFGFFCLVVAPAHYYAPDEPAWVAGVVLLSGIIPMLFVAYTTAPFVTYIHLRLPEFARQSRESLLRYSRHLPRNATIDITTLNIIGRPRVSRVGVADLHPVRSRFSITNYSRGAKDEEMKRPWWAARPIKQFAILAGRGRSREEGVWENVARSIKRSYNEGDPVLTRKSP